jgi:hypothetical protein
MARSTTTNQPQKNHCTQSTSGSQRDETVQGQVSSAVPGGAEGVGEAETLASLVAALTAATTQLRQERSHQKQPFPCKRRFCYPTHRPSQAPLFLLLPVLSPPPYRGSVGWFHPAEGGPRGLAGRASPAAGEGSFP